jgi:ADP-L-glycero-D-manno-heptose 6-epimerase
VRGAAGGKSSTLAELQQQNMIEYGPFPVGLKDKYQSFTEANLDDLRAAGYSAPFSSVQTGVGRYVGWLLANR